MPDIALPPVRPSRHVMATITDEGAMLLDLRGRGRWYALSPSGSLWWKHVAVGASTEQSADAVAAAYHVDPARVHADIRRLVDDLLRRRLVEPLTPRRGWWWW